MKFIDELNRIGLSAVELEAVTDLYKACFEQIANDINAKRNGSINRRPSLIGAKQVGYGTDEWFPKQTLSDEAVQRAKDAQMGYRVGCWGGPGRTVLGKSSALSIENVCADTNASN